MNTTKDEVQSANDVPGLYRAYRSYLEVAGTNIEDMDRAVKNGLGPAISSKQSERPISG